MKVYRIKVCYLKFMLHSFASLPAVIISLEPFVHQYGYYGIGFLLLIESIGIPFPGEATLITAAVFAGLGELNIFGVILVGILACVLGSSIGYLVGLIVGRKLVEKYGKYILLDKDKYSHIEDFFNRRGVLVVIIARFIEVLRQLYGFIAGTSSMSFKKFSVFSIIGSSLWVGFWSAIGYYSGNHIGTILKYDAYLSIIFGVFVVLWIIRLLITKRKNTNVR